MSHNYKDRQSEIKTLWQETSMDAKYLAHKFGMTEQSIRTIVRGLTYPHKEKRALSAFHRVLGLSIVDTRLTSPYSKQDFAKLHGMSHIRLSNLEKGYDDITITEIIKLGLLDTVTSMDASLLGND